MPSFRRMSYSDRSRHFEETHGTMGTHLFLRMNWLQTTFVLLTLITTCHGNQAMTNGRVSTMQRCFSRLNRTMLDDGFE